MHEVQIYILWLQVFANAVSVFVTFKIGRMKIVSSAQWFTFSASLAMALAYRLIKVFTEIKTFTFFNYHKVFFDIFGNIVLLPLTAFLIMVFVIQVYKTIKRRV